MAQIEVRLAAADDRAAMLAFLRDHWRADHIFVRAPEVFDWQYRTSSGGYNVALAVEAGGAGRILGFLGFIPTGHFDPALGQDEILLAIWKVRDDIAPPGLGLRLLKLIQGQIRPGLIGAVGISDMVGPIYRAFKYHTGTLDHLALFPPHAVERIARGLPSGRSGVAADRPGWHLAPLSPKAGAEVDALARSGPGLRKSAHYLQTRYSEHPWYAYSLRGLYEGEALRAIAVWRRVEAEGAALLRIVDLIGPAAPLAAVSGSLLSEVRAAGADYIDLMCYGFETALLTTAGWISPSDTSGLILPNYFAPFEPRNIEIALAWKDFNDPDRSLALFRADSDQDRPNRLEELDSSGGQT